MPKQFLPPTLLILLTLSLPTLAQTPLAEPPGMGIEQNQRKLQSEQEQLRLENNNLQLQETELQLKKRILTLEQQQLGISDTTKPMSLKDSGTTFGTLTAIPIESKILVFQSSNEVAEIIARDILQVSQDAEIKALVIYSQREFAKVNGYRLYNSIRKALVAAYQDAGIKPDKPKPTRDLNTPPSPLQTSTTVLKSVAELLSYFRSEDVININEFKPTGQNFLTAQLVAALRKQKSTIKVYAPSIYLMNFEQYNSPIETFLNDLNDLAILKAQALKQMSQSTDFQMNQRLVQLNIQADLLLNLLKETDFQASNYKPETGRTNSSESNGSQIFQLIQGAQISELLNSRDKRVLVVDLLESGGSTRTRRSLFTNIFTGQSVSYSGGVAVQYFLINPDNSFAAGDVVYRSSGFKAMRGPIGN